MRLLIESAIQTNKQQREFKEDFQKSMDALLDSNLQVLRAIQLSNENVLNRLNERLESPSQLEESLNHAPRGGLEPEDTGTHAPVSQSNTHLNESSTTESSNTLGSPETTIVTHIHQKIEMRKAPIFRGDSDNSMEFLFQFNDVADINNWTGPIKIAQARGALEASAKSWYYNVFDDRTPATWAEFEEKFKEHFFIGNEEDVLREKLRMIGQGLEESPLSFCDRVIELCRMLDKRMPERSIISYVVKGINRESQETIKLHDPQTLVSLNRVIKILNVTWKNNRIGRTGRYPRRTEFRANTNTPSKETEEEKKERMKNIECHNCKEKGHYIRTCPKLAKEKPLLGNNNKPTEPQTSRYPQRGKKIDAVEKGRDLKPLPNLNYQDESQEIPSPLEKSNIELSSVEIMKVSSDSTKDSLQILSVRANGKEDKATFDSEAFCTIIPASLAEETWTPVYRWKGPLVRLADGHQETPVGYCQVFVHYDQRTTTISALILRNAPDVLLGRDFARKAGIVMSFPDNIVTYHDRFIEQYARQYIEKTRPLKVDSCCQCGSDTESINSMDQQPPPVVKEMYIEYAKDCIEINQVNTTTTCQDVDNEPMLTAKQQTIIPPAHRAIMLVKPRNAGSEQLLIEPDHKSGLAFVPGIIKNRVSTIEVFNVSSNTVYVTKDTKIGNLSGLDHEETTGCHQELVISDLLEDKQRAKLNQVIEKYKNIFVTSDEEIGLVPDIFHHIDTGDSSPITSNPYYVSKKEREVIKNMVEKMLKAEIILPSRSPWASPVILVKKKGTSDLRFCVDYRKLNKITKTDGYPIPNMEQVLESISGNHWFSKLDVKAMYWQVKMSETDRQKTAFVVHLGQFEFNVMPFGLVSAPMTAMRVMNEVTRDMDEECFVFYDDVLVYTSTFEKHLVSLEKLFKRLHEANIKLNARKCEIAFNSILYLGHIVTPEGLRPDPSKLTAITQFKSPTNLTEAGSFMGMCNFFRRYIKNFADHARPVNNTIKTKQKFQWTTEAEAAFHVLKRKLTNPPVLVHYDQNGHLVIRCDASGYGIGGVLIQESQDFNKKGVVAYTSRKLQGAELNYSTTHKECLALVHCVTHWRTYLFGHEFTIQTDHHALCWLMSLKDPLGRLIKWSLLLQEYKFKIMYSSGRTHNDADCLSRYPQDNDQARVYSDEVPTWPVTAITRSRKIATPQSDTTQQLLPIKDISAEQMKQNDLKEIIEYLQDPSKNLKRSKGLAKKYALIDKKLYRKGRRPHNNQLLLIIPKTMVNDVLSMMHDQPTGGHFGMKRTFESVKRRFFWPSIQEDVHEYVRSCDICQKRKGNNNKPYGMLGTIPIPSQIFETIGLDLIGPLPPSSRSRTQYVLHIWLS